MAIQDGQALYNALEVAKGDLDEALQKFNEVRHQEVRNAQILAQVQNSVSSSQSLLYCFW